MSARSALLLVLIASVAPPAFSAQEVVSYEMQVALLEDDQGERRVVEGELLLTWVNPGRAAVRELQFHLYQNAS
jgi:hypothetical protein